MSGMFARRAIALVRGARLSSGSADGGYGGSVKLWRNLTLFVAFPAIAVCMVNVYLDEDHSRPEFIKYDYLRIRGKRFPWGDGNKSLFHNPIPMPCPKATKMMVITKFEKNVVYLLFSDAA